jgi:hypothetical protein
MPKGTGLYRHHAQSLPKRITDDSGTSFLTFECVLCGAGLVYELDAEDCIVKEYVIPPAA